MTIQTKYKVGDYVSISYNKLHNVYDIFKDISAMTLRQDFPLYGMISRVLVSATEGITTRGTFAETVIIYYKIKILSPSYMRTSDYTSDRYFPEVEHFCEEDIFSSFEEMEEYSITEGCHFLQKGFDKEDIKQIIKDNEI